ncbi:putative hydroquinone glucosyltransferase [Rosa chinensis]|uniref:Putative hydroquinone glucosyltransferase n=1 Tax=Rosa chinensis TaxID=74649 RepID=A0A2P6PDD5_ROSCH|nr:putative hydroquinone glucosyltransferase [Rosa chinensis]
MEPAGQFAIVPTPGLGHLIPLLELAKRLVVHHNFTSPSSSPKTSISSTFLPPVNFDDLPPESKVETKIALTLARSLFAVRDSVKALRESTRLVSLVVDLFGPEAFDVAIEFNVLPYLFFPTSAMDLWFVFELPKLDETTTCEYRDLPEPVQYPGCVPLQGRDLADLVQDRSNDAYKAAAGIMVNSFADLEPGAFKAFKEQGPGLGLPPVYPVGPVRRMSWVRMSA